MDGFLNCLGAYIDTLEVSDMVYKSSFWRVRKTFQYHSFGFSSFYIWLRYVANLYKNEKLDVQYAILDFENSMEDQMTIQNIINFEPTPINHKHSENNPIKLLKMYRVDVFTVTKLATFHPIVTKRATVKGCELRARGAEYSELSETNKKLSWMSDNNNQLILPTNPLNNMQDVWNTCDGSWMKFLQYDQTTSTKVRTETLYAQGNYFTVVDLLSDPYLHNLALVNVTARITKSIPDEGLTFVQVKITTPDEVTAALNKRKSLKVENNFKDNIQFVALAYVLPTTVAICGFTAASTPDGIDKKPILVKDSAYSTEEYAEGMKFCSIETSDIDRLYLIDLVNFCGDQDGVEACSSDLRDLEL